MHKIYSFFVILICYIILPSTETVAQIVVGTKVSPSQGAILEIKTKESSITSGDEVTDSKNITSERGGVVLPRVKLQDINTLEPFILNNDPNIAKEKLKHAGMIVYNINESYLTTTDPQKVFKQGIYLWDGSRWSMLEREEFKFFHMPSFNLDTSETGTFTLDLYDLYTSHFAREGAYASTYPSIIRNPAAKSPTVPIFKRNELNYFVTYHDNSIVKILKIENDGKMTYEVDPQPPFNNFSYMNIVLVVK